MRFKAGQLVKFHNTLSFKRNTGLILKIEKKRKETDIESYSVYWHSSVISSHMGWELLLVETINESR